MDNDDPVLTEMVKNEKSFGVSSLEYSYDDGCPLSLSSDDRGPFVTRTIY